MLLYDRVVEKASRAELDEENANQLSWLMQAHVYDISECAFLLNDWNKVRSQPICKRPPFDEVWCEWDQPCDNGQMNRAGTWIVKIEPEIAHNIIYRPNSLMSFTRDESREQYERGRTCGEFYHSTSFLRESDAAFYVVNIPIIWIALDDCSLLLDFRYQTQKQYDKMQFSKKCHENGESGICLGGKSLFNFPELIPHKASNNASLSAWPAFMAFALLHCKNVVTEINSPDEKIQRDCAKHNRPPRATYKTLKIEVPKSVHARQAYAESEEDGPKVRFHICSGHLKNLQHERYKNKGLYWWPAHWRGSEELGRIDKRYKLDGRE